MKYLEPKTAHKHIMKYKTTVKTLVTYKEIYMLGAFLFFFFTKSTVLVFRRVKNRGDCEVLLIQKN